MTASRDPRRDAGDVALGQVQSDKVGIEVVGAAPNRAFLVK